MPRSAECLSATSSHVQMPSAAAAAAICARKSSAKTLASKAQLRYDKKNAPRLPWTILHEAPWPHDMPAAHMSAQYFSPVERFSSAHRGTASAPAGLSAGHEPSSWLQCAVHMPPRMPCTLMACKRDTRSQPFCKCARANGQRRQRAPVRPSCSPCAGRHSGWC